MKVCAVIVTWNRIDLLRQAVQQVLEQTTPPERIIIVDNCSDDGTWSQIDRWCEADARFTGVRTVGNIGGSGGFAVGIGLAIASGCAASWILDDDTLADPACLEELVNALQDYPDDDAPVFASSAVRWRDGLPHPMNWPTVMHSDRQEQHRFVSCLTHGHAPLRATTYVSSLFRTDVLAAHQLPYVDFFIWSDDIEHTNRLTHPGRYGVFVPTSTVEHATPKAHSCLDAKPDRFFLHVRNGFWNILTNPAIRAKRRVWICFHLVSIWRYLRIKRNRNWTALRWCLKGIRAGVFTRPRPNPPISTLVGEQIGRVIDLVRD